MAHAFNPATREAEAVGTEFEASLNYRARSRTAKYTQRTRLEKKNTKNIDLCLCVLCTRVQRSWFSPSTTVGHSDLRVFR